MDDKQLQEMYRLTQENNRMLRHMRRNAFISGIFRVLMYAAIVIIPLWFYYVYMAPVVEDMLKTMQQIQGTGAKAQAQFSGLQQMWQEFQDKMHFNSN